MTFWYKYWARTKAMICIAVALAVLLLPVPYAHAEMMIDSADYSTSAAHSGAIHQQHSDGFDQHSNIVGDTTDTTDTHHDNQCCPAGCLSVALVDLFTNVSPEKTSVQAGLTPRGLTSVDMSAILRPPLS